MDFLEKNTSSIAPQGFRTFTHKIIKAYFSYKISIFRSTSSIFFAEAASGVLEHRFVQKHY